MHVLIYAISHGNLKRISHSFLNTAFLARTKIAPAKWTLSNSYVQQLFHKSSKEKVNTLWLLRVSVPQIKSPVEVYTQAQHIQEDQGKASGVAEKMGSRPRQRWPCLLGLWLALLPQTMQICQLCLIGDRNEHLCVSARLISCDAYFFLFHPPNSLSFSL